MASWIVHLRVAENLLKDHPEWNRGYFAIGNVAPDSGLPDEAWENFDPPPELLHFKVGQDGGWDQLADLEYFRRYLEGLEANELDAEVIALRWGYFCHLVVDNLWRDEIAQPTHERYSSEFDADTKFIWTVKRDWYGLDFHYVRQHPQFIFWHEFQTTDCEIDPLDFLPPENIQIRVDYIREYYQRTDDELEQWLAEMPGIYLSEEEMDGFVDRSNERLTKIIRWLRSAESVPHKPVSCLDMPIG